MKTKQKKDKFLYSIFFSTLINIFSYTLMRTSASKPWEVLIWLCKISNEEVMSW